MKYNLICMSFDGDYVTERFMCDTIEQTWNESGDMGSRWFFFPFHFVVTESGKTIVDSGDRLEFFNRKKLNTVKNIFNKVSSQEEMDGADCDLFVEELYNIFKENSNDRH